MKDALHWMTLPLKKYAQFNGRSRRKEYWMYVLGLFIVFFIAGVVDTVLGYGEVVHTVAPGHAYYGWYTHNGPLTLLVSLGTLIPNLAVTIRRLHDINKSGFWLLIGFVPVIGAIALLVFMCLDGTPDSNRFGDSPQTL